MIVLLHYAPDNCKNMYVQGKKKERTKTDKGDSSHSSDSNAGEDQSLPKKKTVQFIIELQTLHMCTKHTGQHCIVHPNGPHHQLTKQDFSLWSLLLVFAKPLFFWLIALTLFVQRLKEYMISRWCLILSSNWIMSSITSGNQVCHKSSQVAIRHHGFPFSFSSHFLPPSRYSSPSASPTPRCCVFKSFSQEPPSSDGFNPEDTPTFYPKTHNWLQSFDSWEELMDRIRSSTQTLLRQMATCSLFKLLKRAKVWKEQRNCHLFALGCQLGLHDLWSSMPLLIVIGSQSRKGGPTRSVAWSK